MTTLASDQALEAATSDVLAAAATMDEAGLAALALDLGAFARVLSGDVRLRRLLTEITVAKEAKTGIVRSLLAGKVDDRSLKLITSTVNQRWAGGRALVDALLELSHTVSFLQVERTGELDEVEDQLFRFGRIVDGNSELSVVLDDAGASAAGKAELIGRLLAGKAHQLTARLLTDLAQDTRGRSFSRGVAALVKQAAARRDKIVATVTSAVALSSDQVETLRTRLGSIYGREVVVHVVVDPAITGGMRVRVGDEVIDGSIAGRLNALRQRLTR